MTIQQSTRNRNHHCSELNGDNTQQVNCKGDKIENIGQLLMHLGMDDIKDKCDDCNIETRKACSEKQSKPVSAKREKIAEKKTLIGSQCADTNFLKSREASVKKRAVESTFVLSSFFASLFIVAITFQ